MHFRKKAGLTLLYLGILILLFGLLAMALPTIDNRQIRLILASFEAPSSSGVLDAVNRLFLDMIRNAVPLAATGGGIALLGGAFLLPGRRRRPLAAVIPSAPGDPAAYAPSPFAPPHAGSAGRPKAGWRRTASPLPFPGDPEDSRELPAPIAAYTPPKIIGEPAASKASLLNPQVDNPYLTYGQSAYAPPSRTETSRDAAFQRPREPERPPPDLALSDTAYGIPIEPEAPLEAHTPPPDPIPMAATAPTPPPEPRPEPLAEPPAAAAPVPPPPAPIPVATPAPTAPPEPPPAPRPIIVRTVPARLSREPAESKALRPQATLAQARGPESTASAPPAASPAPEAAMEKTKIKFSTAIGSPSGAAVPPRKPTMATVSLLGEAKESADMPAPTPSPRIRTTIRVPAHTPQRPSVSSRIVSTIGDGEGGGVKDSEAPANGRKPVRIRSTIGKPD